MNKKEKEKLAEIAILDGQILSSSKWADYYMRYADRYSSNTDREIELWKSAADSIKLIEQLSNKKAEILRS